MDVRITANLKLSSVGIPYTNRVNYKNSLSSGVARAFPGGRVAHPEVQNEEENEEKLRKNEGKYRKIRKIEETFLSCPPGSERLATALSLSEREFIFSSMFTH